MQIMHLQNMGSYYEFLANISLMVAKTSVAIYLVKQTPLIMSSYDFVKFLQKQYKLREQEKEALINYYFFSENKPNGRNSNCEIRCIEEGKTTELGSYTIYNSSRLKIAKYNLQNLTVFHKNQSVHQIKYNLNEILSSSYNILFHAFKKDIGENRITSRKLNDYTSIKHDVQVIFRLWIDKTMKLLKGDWQDLNECLDFLMKFIISDDISSDLDGNLWHTTTLELNLILSSSFKAHLNTQSYSGIAKYITHFLNNSLKKTYERFQTLISTKGKMLYTRASNCAQLIWLSVNLLKYFDDDDEIFDKTQAFKWVQILDKCFELQQLSTKETGRFPMVQLTGLMFIMFVLKNKIIRHTIKG
ncbi:hypothetical protein KSF78_0001321 [Schistosoma japonicum]|nr:hypothetical protein KSF78_0001321 [Schistosoma japonicum]KAH8853114.1 hypothetical protein KSF78_0001321 [Schistosoma japonicum]KAH8853116.1 hypothetical protein KSF78_0001321 [Schistosoma japonicum]